MFASSTFQVKARDADEGLNSQIKYSITAGSKKEHFSIDEDTGLIKTAAKLDFETTRSYQLTVTGRVNWCNHMATTKCSSLFMILLTHTNYIFTLLL